METVRKFISYISVAEERDTIRFTDVLYSLAMHFCSDWMVFRIPPSSDPEGFSFFAWMFIDDLNVRRTSNSAEKNEVKATPGLEQILRVSWWRYNKQYDSMLLKQDNVHV